MNKIETKLRRLSNWYKIVGIIGCVFAILPVVLIARIVIETSHRPLKQFELIVLSGIILFMIFVNSLFFLAAYRLKRASYYSFCEGVARLMCLFFPVGTIVGINTLLLLKDEETKSLFANHHRNKNKTAKFNRQRED